MGSFIEINDTLQITTLQGFPKEIRLEKHIKIPFTAKHFAKKVFSFVKPGKRLYHSAPTRCFLVHNINDKWLYWGHILILKQSINSKNNTTSGEYRIIKIYNPQYQKIMTKNESSHGKSYF